MIDCCHLVFGALCQQGSSLVPISLSARILMFLAFLVLMFLYASYSANVVALLQAPSNKINNLEDLLYSRMRLAAEDNVFQRFYFTVSFLHKFIKSEYITNSAANFNLKINCTLN